jgi:hypothetical protein
MKEAIGIVLYSLFFVGIGAVAVEATDDTQLPRLVGHNCLGATGDIYANEETDFPTMCQSIEENTNG